METKVLASCRVKKMRMLTGQFCACEEHFYFLKRYECVFVVVFDRKDPFLWRAFDHNILKNQDKSMLFQCIQANKKLIINVNYVSLKGDYLSITEGKIYFRDAFDLKERWSKPVNYW